MARLAGVDIPNEKRIEIALTYIFGVGRTRAKQTLAATGINPDIRVKDLTDEQLVSAPRPMLAPARARSARSPERRRPPSNRWRSIRHEVRILIA